jgi:hypothetical protein
VKVAQRVSTSFPTDKNEDEQVKTRNLNKLVVRLSTLHFRINSLLLFSQKTLQNNSMISNKRKRPLWVVNVDKLEAHIGRALSAPAEETKCNLISVEQALISSPSTRVQPVDAKAQSDDAVESEIPFQDVSKIFTHKYNLEKKIGHGGHAEVFACCEKLTGLPFAVKISRKWQDADKSKWYHNSGRNEAMMLIGLNHPRIVSLRDFLDENGRIYMVTDLAGGGALFELIGKLHEFEIRRIFARFFEGVKYLVSTSYQNQQTQSNSCTA